MGKAKYYVDYRRLLQPFHRYSCHPSRVKLAEVLGVSPSVIARISKGDPVGAKTAQKIAEKFPEAVLEIGEDRSIPKFMVNLAKAIEEIKNAGIRDGKRTLIVVERVYEKLSKEEIEKVARERRGTVELTFLGRILLKGHEEDVWGKFWLEFYSNSLNEWFFSLVDWEYRMATHGKNRITF
ncbi:MAG: hypothetical protein QW196_01500 [Sulfolobales archaeon]